MFKSNNMRFLKSCWLLQALVLALRQVKVLREKDRWGNCFKPVSVRIAQYGRPLCTNAYANVIAGVQTGVIFFIRVTHVARGGNVPEGFVKANTAWLLGAAGKV